MELYLVSSNSHKFEEVKSILEPFGIIVHQIKDEKYEPKDMGLEDVAIYNSRVFYEKYKKPVVVDDTGVFFDAFPGFPGNHPKLMFELLGYRGLLKLLKDEQRGAEFKTVVGYCDPGGVKIFRGSLKGQIDNKVNDQELDVLPYERIFLVDGRPMSKLSREEKNKISHRSDAFRRLGSFLRQNLR